MYKSDFLPVIYSAAFFLEVAPRSFSFAEVAAPTTLSFAELYKPFILDIKPGLTLEPSASSISSASAASEALAFAIFPFALFIKSFTVPTIPFIRASLASFTIFCGSITSASLVIGTLGAPVAT